MLVFVLECALREKTGKSRWERVMQDTKQRILTLLKMNGGLTTSDLSDMLGISATAVRRHLNTLEAQNLVAYRSEQRGMGRPSFIYELAAGATSVFPQSYAAFASEVLEELLEMDGNEKLDELFDRRQEKRRKQYVSRTEGQTLSDRVASLARLLDGEGRMTTWEQLGDGRFILREHNCPILDVARKFDHPCRCEISLLRETLQARVKRVGHIPDGDIACVYEIEAQSKSHVEGDGDSIEIETRQTKAA
jgi:predicted ArsR family transcriptional regulator